MIIVGLVAPGAGALERELALGMRQKEGYVKFLARRQ
jgi:hypothetical protein